MSYDDRNADQNIDDRLRTPSDTFSSWRIVICLLLILSGVTLGVTALALVSNQFGNTDTIGLPLLGLAGWVSATGLSYLRFRFPVAALIGMIAAPLTVFSLFVLFWLWLIVTAIVNAQR